MSGDDAADSARRVTQLEHLLANSSNATAAPRRLLNIEALIRAQSTRSAIPSSVWIWTASTS